jgi:hypothetical protein
MTDLPPHCVHEAGHAVLAVICGFTDDLATVFVRADGTGLTQYHQPRFARDRAPLFVLTQFGGIESEMLYCQDRETAEASSGGDYAAIHRMMDELKLDWSSTDLLNYRMLAASLVHENREAIIRVADSLAERRILSGQEVAEIVRRPASKFQFVQEALR